jgi:uncharacterized membrane protein YjgN (DUF898 family)
MTENTQQKHTSIVFQGKTSEYFGIWIVNLLLSLVTLGIYSAWAKVRRKKYFYNNTLIEKVGFDYHANPMAILKGRIIAVIFFALYAYGKGSSPILAGIVLLLFVIALPWLVVRGSIFNARNSSHRGLRFDFMGTLRQAARVYFKLPFLTGLTLGAMAPYAAHERKQFIVNNHRFGLSQFDMSRVVKGFYKVYLIVFIVPFIGILAAIAIPAYQAYVTKAKAAAAPHATLSVANVQAFTPIILAANEVPVELPAEAPTVERVYSDNAPAEAAPAIEPTAETLAEPTAPAAEAPIEQAADEPEVIAPEDVEPAEMTAEEEKALEEMIKQQQKQATQDKMKEWLTSPLAWLIGLGGLLLYGFFIFGFLAYFQARIGNLIWNNTTLDKLSFKSNLRARDFFWLYFSNMVAIMLTFGLATPWAQIRMAKYRTSKLQIVGDVDFDQFVGDKKAEVKATGEEIADMFDVDLSFG